MKLNIKRGSLAAGASGAPEESYVRGAGIEPAPAGALQRAYAGIGGYGADDFDAEEAPYKPRLGSFRMRLKGGLPGSMTGRVALGFVLFVLLGALAAVVFETRKFLLHDERFVIPASAQIQTVGNVHLTRAQLLSVFGEDVERNIFKVPLETRRDDLERLPWVAHATVMRLLPNRIRVSVTERTPVAFVREGNHIGLVDGSGVLLDMPEDSAGDPHYSFPVLTGLSVNDALSTRAARMEIYRRFVKELDGSGEKISDSLSEVDVSSPEDLKALIPSGGADILVHFGDEKFLERYRHFEEHLVDWKTQYPKLASADMRYDRQVVLEMLPGTGVPLSAAPTAAAPAAADGDAANVAETKPVVAKAAVVKASEKAVVAKAPVKATAVPVKSASVKAKPGIQMVSAKQKMVAALAAARQPAAGQGQK